ncbi:Multidrug resistance protein 3 [Corynebacterium occultum]|uniref:Multidrug resistance protein 3 n=1 Tax=Corynebacterium occultum TaxID=2675219 RepID=A0A6B8VN06_9CORY|nr:MDR family MFS transporter [Corynebacterium occultum]QGU06882.1 Multidrug resistance protein 3 [Corynebacterium occultum]
MSTTSVPAAGEVERDPKSKRTLHLIIAALMLTMLMSSLGQMIFSTALPTIVGELGGVNHMSWVITAFLLGMTIALPIFGKLGDQIGRKELFIAAIIMFIVGSVLGALAPNMGMLIAARAIQGVAGGAIQITSQAITAEVTTPRERGKYMGIMGSVFGVSSVAGPVLGGWFTDGPGWRWGLWFNVPLGLIAIIAIALLLKLPQRERKFQADWMGTMTMALSTASLVLFVTWGGNEYEWGDPLILGLIAAFVVFAVLFVLIELKAKDPIIPMTLFKNRNFVLTTLVGLGIGVFMFGALAYLPTYLQMVYGMSPTAAGLMMIPMMIGLMGTSIAVGNLISRSGKYKWYPMVGMVITGIGLILLSLQTTETSLVTVGLYFFIFGFGLGCAMQVIVLIVQTSFPLSMVGTATGANNFFRQVGGTLGSALVGGMFISNLSSKLPENLEPALASMGPDAAPYVEQFSSAEGSNSLTPALIETLPEVLQNAIQVAYNDSLTPVFLLLCPLAFIAAALLLGIKEGKLSDKIESLSSPEPEVAK